MPEPSDARRESRARRQAENLGLILRKSRLRGDPHDHDLGGWMLVDANRNWIVAGENFDLDLDTVCEILEDANAEA